MLPAAARLRRREDFSLVVRRGRRAGRQALVAHYLPAPDAAPPDAALSGAASFDAAPPEAAPPEAVSPEAAPPEAAPPARAGFVVGRSVGNSVVRHRVIRRLRHLVRDRLGLLPAGSRLVVRALPPAGTAAQLGLRARAAIIASRRRRGSTRSRPRARGAQQVSDG